MNQNYPRFLQHSDIKKDLPGPLMTYVSKDHCERLMNVTFQSSLSAFP